jgi:guanosine-3',5'-bis(diphosphate) 3'-pyrophosphohydrolase
MKTIADARAYAAVKHAYQEYDGKPYLTHLDSVVEILSYRGFGPDFQVAGYLHDVVEDTKTTLDDLRAEGFSEWVVDKVWRVTNEPGYNRAERHAKTYPKIAVDEAATALKLADRIANTEASIKLGSKGHYLGMYLKEYPGFRRALKQPSPQLVLHDMWEHLDELYWMSV